MENILRNQMSMGKLYSCLKVLQVIFCLAGVIFGLLDNYLPLQFCGSAASSSEAGYNIQMEHGQTI